MTDYLASNSQTFEITIGAGQTSNTATITAVGSLAFILPGGQTSDGTAANESFARVTLTNSTTVTATRNTSDVALVCVVRGTVVDASASLVDSVEFGTVTITSSTSGTATITSVTTADSAVIWLGTTTTAAAVNMSTALASLTLTNATTVTATGGASQTTTTSFCVVDFAAAALAQATQAVVFTSTSNQAVGTSTITAVTSANAMLLYGGYNSGLGSMASLMMSELTATTTVTHTRTGTNTTTRTVKVTAVDFASGVLTSNQKGNTPISGATTADENITAVTLNNAALNWVGYMTTATTTPAQGFASAKFLDLDTVQSAKLSSTANSTTSWEAVEFGRDTGNAVTETATVTDSYAASRTSSVTQTETVTPSESNRVTRTASVTVSETATPSDSYVSQVIYVRTLTETITPTDSNVVSGTGRASRSETATATDTSVVAATNSVANTETATATDNLTGVCSNQGQVEETCTPSDTNAGLATGSTSVEESVAANDNYDSSLNPAPSPAPEPEDTSVPGPSDGGWDNYLKWLKKKKRKQFRKIAARKGISEQKVDSIIEEAAIEVVEKLPDLSPVTVDYVADEELARNVAQKTILAIYDRIWEEETRLRAEQDEEDDLLMMMM